MITNERHILTQVSRASSCSENGWSECGYSGIEQKADADMHNVAAVPKESPTTKVFTDEEILGKESNLGQTDQAEHGKATPLASQYPFGNDRVATPSGKSSCGSFAFDDHSEVMASGIASQDTKAFDAIVQGSTSEPGDWKVDSVLEVPSDPPQAEEHEERILQQQKLSG